MFMFDVSNLLSDCSVLRAVKDWNQLYCCNIWMWKYSCCPQNLFICPCYLFHNDFSYGGDVYHMFMTTRSPEMLVKLCWREYHGRQTDPEKGAMQ